MDRQYHVSARLLFNVVQEGAELVLASSRLDVPRRFGLSNYDDLLSSGIHVGAIPIDHWRHAVGGW